MSSNSIQTFLQSSQPFKARSLCRNIQTNNSHSFLTAHSLLMIRDAAATIALLTFLAECGHSVIQRIQEIHFPGSVSRIFPGLIARAGHCFAHKPHPVQSFVAFGTNPAPAFLYGRFPGTGGAALNCPPETITLYRICMALEPDTIKKLVGVHAMPSPLCPIGKNIHAVLEMPYSKIRKDLRSSMQSVTLNEIIEEYQNVRIT